MMTKPLYSNYMKIALCGRNRISNNILSILERKHNVCIKCFTSIQSEKFNDVFGDFSTFSEAKGFDVCRSDNTKEGIESLFIDIEKFNPDLILSVQFPFIFKKTFISLFKNKILNIHFGHLPQFRGVAPISHAIISGCNSFGVTFHIIDKGIDTGPIVFSNMFDIKGLRNSEIYDLCISHATDVFEKNIDFIIKTIEHDRHLKNISTKQDSINSRYYSKKDFDYENNIIDFTQDMADVLKKMRAYYFPPLTYPMVELNNATYKIIDFIEAESFSPSNKNNINEHTFKIKDQVITTILEII